MKAPLPPTEAERLRTLQRCEIIDTKPEQEFDDITLLASHICETPIALITLLDENRQWFKSRVGISAIETARDLAFCAHAILQTDVFVVEDAQKDERFADNPLVTCDPKIRFYAGSPLIMADGQALGTLCVIDRVPRTLSVAQKQALQALSRQVVAQLELRHSLRELRQSEERFFGAFLHAPIGVSLVSPEGRWLKVNRALCTLVGYSEAELLTRTFQDITHPDDLPTDLNYVRQTLAGEISTYQMEKRYVHKNGDIITVLLSVSLVRDDHDQPLYFISQVQDITRRKESEMEIRFNEQRYRSLVEATTAIVWDMPASGEFKAEQPRWNDFTGQSFEEYRGWGWLDAIHPDDQAETGRLWSIAVANKSIYEVEQRVRAQDKSYHDMLVRAVPIMAEDGTIRQWIGVHTDITERKRAEEALRLLGAAVEQSDESILITDAQLELPGPKIVFVNPAFTKMTGYTAQDVIGKTPRILQGPRTDKSVLSRLRKNLEQGEVFAGEAINYREGGKEFNLEWQVAPIRNGSGKTTHFVAIQHDVTERKRLEAQLFQSQKMETVGKLAGGIAHEFNSILTAIIGQSELLLGDLPTGSPLVQNATEISKAAQRAATLTRQLLAYSRRQILQPELLDLNQVIASMSGVFYMLMGVEVDTQIVPATSLKAVKADAGQIEQVIINLVMNARDAMPNGGKLTLETANVSLDEEYVRCFPEFEIKAGEYVMLAITDTGSGMSAEVKARVFEPFFSTKGVGQGTGLGLSTCYGIVKQSGGHISVYSELGRGTTFKVYLPQIASEIKSPVQHLVSSDLPRGKETILLVEDDSSLRDMAATLLRRLGYTVLAAANGIEALSLKYEPGIGHIDLLFTDIVMPHMSGKELADRVLALSPYTKILFTSAYTINAIVHQGVLDDGVVLLQKPFTPSALAYKLREILDQPNALKPDDAPKIFGSTKIAGGENTP